MFFMENRYLVLKNFIPQEIIDMAMDVWKTIEAQPNVAESVFELEEDIIFESGSVKLYTFHAQLKIRFFKESL